jgi:hypothetical protein
VRHENCREVAEGREREGTGGKRNGQKRGVGMVGSVAEQRGAGMGGLPKGGNGVCVCVC